MKQEKVDTLIEHANYCRENGDYQKAVELYQEVLYRDPTKINVAINLGSLLTQSLMSKEAIAVFQFVLKQDDKNSFAWAGLANCYLRGGQIEQALVCAHNSIKYDPQGIGVAYLGFIYRVQEHFDRAITCFRRSLTYDPNQPEVRFALAFCQLMLQNFDASVWQDYEARWENRSMRHKNIPLWSANCSLKDKSILIWAEQGFGDTIQFARLIHKFKQEYQPKKIIFEVPIFP